MKLTKILPVVALSLLPLVSQASETKEVVTDYAKSVATGVVVGQAISSSLGNGIVDVTPVARSVAVRMAIGYALPKSDSKETILKTVDCGLSVQGWYFLGLAFSGGVSGIAHAASLGAFAGCFIQGNTTETVITYPDPMTSN